MLLQVRAANETVFNRIAPHFASLVAALIPGHSCWLSKTGTAAHEVRLTYLYVLYNLT